MPLQAMLPDALARTSECSGVDFKSAFNSTSPGDWLEIVKDVVAIANSGGGVILIGLDDDGNPTSADVTGIRATDPADLTN